MGVSGFVAIVVFTHDVELIYVLAPLVVMYSVVVAIGWIAFAVFVGIRNRRHEHHA